MDSKFKRRSSRESNRQKKYDDYEKHGSDKAMEWFQARSYALEYQEMMKGKK